LKEIKRYIPKIFFLILFLGYYGSITLFTHYHIVNGVTIVHSHPYKNGSGSSQSGHQHNSNGLMLIQLISEVQSCVSGSCSCITNPDEFATEYIFKTCNNAWSESDIVNSNPLRAPPVCLA